ncbi:6778_t:CDS:2 [Entrophospora sp. SA101]|nr:7372_t:CDS:2 [Entrophospora sp. SA101]CAJ0824766.1 6778_t:CDS:2 [Entrophospora sp. SA101]
MILLGTYFTGQVPFQQVLLHGLIRDKYGKKMSKSLGNGVEPDELVKKYGCDSLRLFLLENNIWGSDLIYNEDKVVGKILQQDFFCHLEKKEINFTITQLVKFVREKLSNEYLELIKISPWDTDTKNTLLFAYQQLLIMLHPTIPFITEHIYQEITQQKILEEKITKIDIKAGKNNLWQIDCLLLLISNIRNFRQKKPLTKSKVFITKREQKDEHDEHEEQLNFYEKECQRSEQLLTNDNFRKKAPPQLVAEERKKLIYYQEQRKKVQDQNYPINGTCQETNNLLSNNNFGKKRIEVTKLKINFLDLEGHLDLRDFVNLEVLHCTRNHLTSLDISKNTKLTELICDNDQYSTPKLIEKLKKEIKEKQTEIEKQKIELELNYEDKELLEELIKKHIEFTKFKKQRIYSEGYYKRIKEYEEQCGEVKETLRTKLINEQENEVYRILTHYEKIAT